MDLSRQITWSIDPGDVHVGLARWCGYECLSAVEVTPDQCVDLLHGAIRSRVSENPAPDVVVIEAFNLRGSLMHEQQGSEFLTPQLIGALRHTCRRADIEVVMQTPWQAKQLLEIEPWKSWAVRAFTSYGHGRHAKDAELHGIKYLRSQLAKSDKDALARWLDAQRLRGRRTGTSAARTTGT